MSIVLYGVAVIGYGAALSILIGMIKRTRKLYRSKKTKNRLKAILRVDNCHKLSSADIAKERLKLIKFKDRRERDIDVKEYTYPDHTVYDLSISSIMLKQARLRLEFCTNLEVRKLLRINQLKGDFINDNK